MEKLKRIKVIRKSQRIDRKIFVLIVVISKVCKFTERIFKKLLNNENRKARKEKIKNICHTIYSFSVYPPVNNAFRRDIESFPIIKSRD